MNLHVNESFKIEVSEVKNVILNLLNYYLFWLMMFLDSAAALLAMSEGKSFILH